MNTNHGPCSHTPDEHEAMQALFDARMAIGKASNGRPHQAVIAAVGLLITDLHESATKEFADDPELLDMIDALVKGVGESFVDLANLRRKADG